MKHANDEDDETRGGMVRARDVADVVVPVLAPGSVIALGDAQRLPMRMGGCDNILLLWVLHVVGDPVAALAEAQRALATAGRVVVVPRPVTPPELCDDVEAIVDAMQAVLRRERPEPLSVVAQAEAAGLVLLERTLAKSRPVGESPVQAAEKIESQTFSSLWDVDAATWAPVVEPAVAEHPRSRTSWCSNEKKAAPAHRTSLPVGARPRNAPVCRPVRS